MASSPPLKSSFLFKRGFIYLKVSLKFSCFYFFHYFRWLKYLQIESKHLKLKTSKIMKKLELLSSVVLNQKKKYQSLFKFIQINSSSVEHFQIRFLTSPNSWVFTSNKYLIFNAMHLKHK